VKLNNKILEELQDIAPTLAKLDKVDFYRVEESYFEDSKHRILESVGKPITEPELSPILSAIKKKELYTAPSSSYFESFSENLIAKINAGEVAEELSYAMPVLQHVEKKESYKVPSAYFASFPDKVAKLVKKEAIESPVEYWSNVWIEISERFSGLISRPGYAFAMASIISAIVCIGLVFNTQNTISGDEKIFAQMQQIPDADLHHYIDRHRDEFDEHTILHNINDVDFTHYFDKPEQVTPHIESHTKGSTDDDITSDILD
jgi:hypothetical protein